MTWDPERGNRLIDGIADAEDRLTQAVRAAVGSANQDLLSVLMEKPYARTKDVIERCSVSRPTATKWLHRLVERDALAQQRIGREVLFVNLPLMSALRGHD